MKIHIGDKFKGAHDMGRPKKWTAEAIQIEADALMAWFKEPEHFWLKDFAIERGYCSQRFMEFSTESEYFSETLKMAKDIQESRLVKMGFSKKHNTAMVIFALKNVAGWRDNPENNEMDRFNKVADFMKFIKTCFLI